MATPDKNKMKIALRELYENLNHAKDYEARSCQAHEEATRRRIAIEDELNNYVRCFFMPSMLFEEDVAE